MSTGSVAERTADTADAVPGGSPAACNVPRGEPFPGKHGGVLRPFAPGFSGNPSGRPKVGRLVATALAELQDTPGETPEAVIEAFKAARGRALCGADHRAIALHRQACNEGSRLQVAAADSYADRVEGKVIQRSEVEVEARALFAPINLPALPAASAPLDAEILSSEVEEEG